MDRTDEAVRQWAEIARNATRNRIGESWGSGVTLWPQAEAAIRERIELLNAQGAAIIPDCVEIRDQL